MRTRQPRLYDNVNDDDDDDDDENDNENLHPDGLTVDRRALTIDKMKWKKE